MFDTVVKYEFGKLVALTNSECYYLYILQISVSLKTKIFEVKSGFLFIGQHIQ